MVISPSVWDALQTDKQLHGQTETHKQAYSQKVLPTNPNKDCRTILEPQQDSFPFEIDWLTLLELHYSLFFKAVDSCRSDCL